MKKTILICALFYFSKACGQIPNTLSPADKIYGLSKFWQEVNYNFVFLDKIDRQMWDSSYRSLIASIPDTRNDYEYYRELQRFCALLKDGHTNVYMPQKKEFTLMNSMFGDYRIFLENIDGKAIIVRTNLSRKNEIPLGSEIIEVNGLSTQAYLQKFVYPYISSSTEYVLEDWGISNLLQGMEGDQYKIKIKKPGGSVTSLTLVHRTSPEQEVFPAFPKQTELLEFKWLGDKTAYLSLNSFGNPKIDTLFRDLLPSLYSARSMIIDLRNNGGGNTNIGTEILQYLTNDTLLYGARSASRLHIPAFKAWGKFTNASDTLNNPWARQSYLSYHDRFPYIFDYTPDTVKLKAKRIIVPTVILLGHKTASAAEDFMIYADKQKHMIRMGEHSFGSTGQPYFFDLPGGGFARVCTKKDTYPDGKEFVGYGIAPHITIKKTLDDYISGRDPVLEKAVEYLVKKTSAKN